MKISRERNMLQHSSSLTRNIHSKTKSDRNTFVFYVAVRYNKPPSGARNEILFIRSEEILGVGDDY